MIVIDDRLLLMVLSERQDTELDRRLGDALATGGVFTTGSWYWRLARAAGASSMGSLSRALSALPEDAQQSVKTALARLPHEIGMMHPRDLVPVMRDLRGHPNLLTAEAVASAVVLDATILVTTESALLNRIATATGVPVEIV